MWCTRWYLPLVLLPFPIAPPFFLWLFLFSTTLHARPCFYCIMLLSALFMSSCYWPPVPLDSPLAIPWSENVTTFADALSTLLPNIPEDLKPAEVSMADRCWCDLSSNGFFEQYNITEWELKSLLRLKEDLEQKVRAREQEESPLDAVHDTLNEESGVSADVEERQKGFRDLWNTVWSFTRRPDVSPAPPLASNSTYETAPHVPQDPLRTQDSNTSSIALPSPPKLSEKQPLLRREYDLRPYGFSLVLDFGWATSES